MKDQANVVEQLRQLLGSDALLLPWPLRSKGTKRKWKYLTVADMTPAYLAELAKGNIGVAVGDKSGGLCSIDADADEFQKEFLSLNPRLRETLRSRGARGCNLWVRFKGAYPRLKILKTSTGEKCGEFRSTGGQTVIHGIHPSGCRYTHNGKPPVVMEFNQIKWPASIAKPPRLEAEPGVCTEEPEDIDAAEDSEVVCVGGVPHSPIQTIEDAVSLCTPTRVHENHQRLFDLARAVLNLEQKEGKATAARLQEVFDLWHQKAAPFLRPDETKEDYWMEFLAARQRAKYPLRGPTLGEAWQKAQTEPLPPESLMFERQERKLLVALCCQLQIANGNAPFYLSGYSCQKFFGHPSHSTSATWLAALVTLGILEVAEKGNRIRATRYRYLPPIQSDVPAAAAPPAPTAAAGAVSLAAGRARPAA